MHFAARTFHRPCTTLIPPPVHLLHTLDISRFPRTRLTALAIFRACVGQGEGMIERHSLPAPHDAPPYVHAEFLTILSLGRNNIKKIEGLEPVADTLQELWLSYNQIERVNGIECCKKLKVVYMSNNKVKAWDGIDKLVGRYGVCMESMSLDCRIHTSACALRITPRPAHRSAHHSPSQKELPALEEILLQGNPLEEKLSAEGTWRDEVSKKYPVLKKLDGKPIIRDDEVTDDAPPS